MDHFYEYTGYAVYVEVLGAQGLQENQRVLLSFYYLLCC